MMTVYLVAALFVIAVAAFATGLMDDERPMYAGMFLALCIVLASFC